MVRIFWAWQSDRDQQVCRHLIKGALSDALKQLTAELDLDERAEVDHDTKGQVGMPDIVESILQKIRASNAFVADLTTIARTQKRKAVANPNVLIELGYAKHALGTDKIICVANSHWFKGPKDLPFDLRNRRAPITYTLLPGADVDARNAAKKALTIESKNALQPIVQAAKDTQPEAQAIPRRSSRERDPSVWFPKGHKLKHQGFMGGSTAGITPNEAPRAYVRISASGWKKGPPARASLNALPDGIKLLAITGGEAGDGGLNEDGYLFYWFRTHNGARVAYTAAQLFLDGEYWAYATPISVADREILGATRVSDVWTEMLYKGFDALEYLSAKPPFSVEIGASRLTHLVWPNDAVVPLKDDFSMIRTVKKSDESERKSLLAEARAGLADTYGLPASALPG